MAPTLLLLHGFTHSGASWNGVTARLGQRYRALTPDLRGHGSASSATPVTLEAVLQDVERLTDEPFTLAGYSMGGRAALHLALAQPDRVRQLVLIGASPGIEDNAERAERLSSDERLADELERSRIGDFAARWARTPILAGLPVDVAAAVHEDRLRSTPAGLARALRGLGTGALPSLWGRLGELAMPVTLVVGERDAKFRATAAAMVARLERGEVVVVPGAGHAVHLEEPGRVADLISAHTS